MDAKPLGSNGMALAPALNKVAEAIPSTKRLKLNIDSSPRFRMAPTRAQFTLVQDLRHKNFILFFNELIRCRGTAYRKSVKNRDGSSLKCMHLPYLSLKLLSKYNRLETRT